MVQLKAATPNLSVNRVFYFNSAMVQLKVMRLLVGLMINPNFNSAMVQLKDKNRCRI